MKKEHKQCQILKENMTGSKEITPIVCPRRYYLNHIASLAFKNVHLFNYIYLLTNVHCFMLDLIQCHNYKSSIVNCTVASVGFQMLFAYLILTIA